VQVRRAGAEADPLRLRWLFDRFCDVLGPTMDELAAEEAPPAA
jgi:hypothetical protein